MSDVLVLNADGQPLNYLPLSAVPWKEAIQQLWLDKINVLEWYDDWIVHSPSWETQVPAVIMLKDYYRRRKFPRFSKYNVFLRDTYICQYCGNHFTYNELTFDHVIPKYHGGKTNWENIVTACHRCNLDKANKLYPKPISEPYRPDYFELVEKRKTLPFNIKHDSWLEWLA